MEKECRSCHVVKPTSDFYAHPTKADGTLNDCKECVKAQRKAAYVRRPQRERPPEGMKKCSTCKEVKSTTEFGSNRTTYDGLQGSCKPCSVAAVTKSRHKDPTAHRRSSKAWREKNPLRHHENSIRHRVGAHVPHGTYDRLFAEQEGKCAICSTTESGSPRT